MKGDLERDLSSTHPPFFVPDIRPDRMGSSAGNVSRPRPVKDVFAKYKLPPQRVTLKGGHATFRVAFPFDPQARPNEATMGALYLDLLRANGGSDYTLESLQDGIAIDVSWKRRPRTIALATADQSGD
jgi:hypothetical protein